MSEWIRVEERLPGNEHLGLPVIVCVKRRYGKPYVDVIRWWATADMTSWQDVTHWMQMPKPPGEEGE